MAQQQQRGRQQDTRPAAPAIPQVSLTVDRYPIIGNLANRFGVDPSDVVPVLKATAFRIKGGAQATDAQIAALLVVAGQYQLNPFTKEIFAFPDKHNGIVPVVSVDGWTRIINEHPAMDGLEFRQSDQMVAMPDGKPAPEWMEVVIYRKDRNRPIVIREYLDEVYQPPKSGTNEDGKPWKVNGPWQTHTKRFLRHKTLIQGARVAFGFAGIYDEDEASRIVEAQFTARVEPASMQPEEVTRAGPADVTDAEFSDVLEDAAAAAGEAHAQTTGDPPQPVTDSGPSAMRKEMADLVASKIRAAGLTREEVEAGIGAPLSPSVLNKAFDWIKKNAKT